MKLKGKVAVVTGASKGIGSAIASHLAAEGANVIVNYASDKKGAMRVATEIAHHGGKAVAVQANITRQEEIEHLFSETLAEFGRLDILVNNAGMYEFAPLEEITPKHFYKMFDLNVLGLLLVTKEAVKHFGESGGSIVNISSVASISPSPELSVYNATKASVDVITKTLSLELGPRNIRVNAINPGLVETEGTHAAGIIGSDFHKQIKEQTPLARIGQPKDIAPAVSFLASDDASWITGESLIISGGSR